MSNEMSDYLEQEVAALDRSFKLGVGAMLVLTVVLIGYFQWLKGMVEEITTPESLSTVVVSEVKRNLPAARLSLEQNLTAAAPDVIGFIAEGVLDEALPLMTDSARALFRDYSRELAGYGRLAVLQSFEAIVKDHRAALAKAKATAEPGMYTPDVISQNLSKTLDAELGNRITDTPRESLANKLDDSVVALRNINRKLQSMSKQGKLTRKEELGRKLITTWWTFLNRSDGAGDAASRMMDKGVKRPVSLESEPIIRGDGTE